MFESHLTTFEAERDYHWDWRKRPGEYNNHYSWNEKGDMSSSFHFNSCTSNAVTSFPGMSIPKKLMQHQMNRQDKELVHARQEVWWEESSLWDRPWNKKGRIKKHEDWWPSVLLYNKHLLVWIIPPEKAHGFCLVFCLAICFLLVWTKSCAFVFSCPSLW